MCAHTLLCLTIYAAMKTRHITLLLGLALLGLQCQSPTGEGDRSGNGFRSVPAKTSRVAFVNQIVEDEENNVLNYEYFYNGGGVAVGDLNQDGRPDLYFTANMGPNSLYLNEGDWSFREVTEAARVAGRDNGWNTGVTIVDINADGLLDIYVCYSGDGPEDERRNELYVNQGNNEEGIPTFVEQAADYGLDLPAHTTQALFFDYDRDNDLDVYLLNHSTEDFQSFDATYVKNISDEFAGDKLLRNDSGSFTEVTEAAGIKNTPLGFGLGVAAADINGDGWLDLYISNDYIEEDYLYINQQDGTFRDELKEQIGHISHFSMGSNIADINNDAHPDILSLDMLPEDNRRQKLLYGPDTYEKYQSMLRNGFYHQIMRNMLQLNNGDGTFSEIGQLAGISNTDWSWAPVFGDFDNDGWKDLFISNGYLRDYTNRDFVSYYADQRIKAQRGQPADGLMDIISRMESTKTPNYMFRNRGDLTFEDKSDGWGFAEPILTQGAARADLDGDGDLDLILNNINEPASLLENQISKGHYLLLDLRMQEGSNPFAIGARVDIRSGGQRQIVDHLPTQGFQSAMHTPVHLGLGDNDTVDTLRVIWPDGTVTLRTGVAADQVVTITKEQERKIQWSPTTYPTLFSESENPLAYEHQENNEVDFKQQTLLPWGISYQGPASVQADFTGDGLADLFLGGAKRQAGRIIKQMPDGTWIDTRQPALTKHLIMEDTDALAFDAEGDGDLDLYVASGGYHFLPEDLALQDRLYLNDGNGNFTHSKGALPPMLTSTGAVAAHDIDDDGDPDLFVGGRLIPGQYPKVPASYLLRNEGDGTFTDVTRDQAPELLEAGLVTDAIWEDADGDGTADLIVAGEWMPIMAYGNKNGQLRPIPDAFAQKTEGWWWSLEKADLDGDGDMDLIAGNLGTNTNLKVSADEPARMYAGDFDENGAVDPLLVHYIQGAPYPFVSRDNLFGQLPGQKKKFTTYEAYSEATIGDILTPEQEQAADIYSVHQGASVWIENEGGGRWTPRPLPVIAQAAPVFTILPKDLNGDGHTDLILAGNLADTRPTMGPWDANYGQVLLNDGKGSFSYLPQDRSGLHVIGDVRSMEWIERDGDIHLLFLRNNQAPVWYRYNKEQAFTANK